MERASQPPSIAEPLAETPHPVWCGGVPDIAEICDRLPQEPWQLVAVFPAIAPSKQTGQRKRLRELQDIRNPEFDLGNCVGGPPVEMYEELLPCGVITLMLDELIKNTDGRKQFMHRVNEVSSVPSQIYAMVEGFPTRLD